MQPRRRPALVAGGRAVAPGARPRRVGRSAVGPAVAVGQLVATSRAACGAASAASWRVLSTLVVSVGRPRPVAAREPSRPWRRGPARRPRSPGGSRRPGRRAHRADRSGSGWRASVAGPLSELVDAAHRIEAPDYSVRVPRARARSAARCAVSAARSTRWPPASKSEDATRRRLLADVSHELRTPLAVIQGNLEALSTASTRPTRRTSPRSSTRRRCSPG